MTTTNSNEGTKMNRGESSTDDTTRRRGRRRATRAALLGAGVAALVAAVGIAPAGAQTTTPPATPGQFPFAAGTLQSISGSTLQLNGRNGTSTVVVTGSTTYTQTTAATVSDIATGDCVRAVGTGSTTAGITATTVSLSKPTSKGCTQPRAGTFRGPRNGTGTAGGFGRRFGNGNGNAPDTNGGQAPQGAPDGGSRPANFGAAFGTVKSISGNQMTVKAQIVTPPTGTNKKPKTTTKNVTVTLGDSTTVTQTTSASQKDLAVGSCVSAVGTTDSVGTVTANRVAISQPQNGACSAFGFGGGPGGFGRGGAGRQGQSPTI
jgi:hypothetical protein